MKKILLVEDDIHIRDIYVRTFSNANYDVGVASDGHQALEKVKNNSYDLILLDILIPGVSGIDVLRAFRDPKSTAVNTPIFLITNLGQGNIIKEAFKIGADGYLLKAQLAPKEIVAEIDKYFEGLKKLKNNSSSEKSS